ncbi:uncharacterized protein LOC124887774 [Capsicum annuum]|uniref:uncharacterized protein LOC124887774 n=1 Tax=Capsicum annuum TaxID=4072 RepID=UPI001FB160F5|nr:uncharacterized protein LOC124887774 [Capsicum annuum]
MAKYFSSSKHTVKKYIFVQQFKAGNFDNNTDALNISILYFIHTFLFSQVRDASISRSDFVMVEDDSTIDDHVDNVIPKIFNWKVVGIKVKYEKYEKFMAGMFSKFVYTNLRQTHEEVQRLDLLTIDGVELNNDASSLSHDTYPDHSGKRHAVDIHTQLDMDHQGFEDFSIVPSPEILMRAGLNTHASASQPTKKKRTVRFDTATILIQDSENTPPFILGKSIPIDQSRTSDSERLDAPTLTPSSSGKSHHQDSSDQRWNELKFFLQFYVDQKFTFIHKIMVKQHEESNDKRNKQHAELLSMLKHINHTHEKDDELGWFTIGGVPSIDNFEEMDIVTSSKDKGKKVKEMVNQELEDIETTTLNGLVGTVVNHNLDYSKVQNPMTKNIRPISEDGQQTWEVTFFFLMLLPKALFLGRIIPVFSLMTCALSPAMDEYLSTISESAQLKIDAIMQGLAAPVDDILLEIIKSMDETVNLHFLSDSQIPSNYPDSVVVAHLAAKSPAK